ncbi:mitotic_arrest deficient 2 like 1 S homeolog [Hexamita inflata]|uniref:Mitotic_arrest deficient 2 like 1 S homeolog n=1 Tax=Hexamita inflata TaxID=28002 RepID=A0ABP1GIB8_9EUKA
MTESVFIAICGRPEHISDYIFASVNEILYQRKVHDQKFFALNKINNQSYHLAQLKNTNEYLQKITTQTSQWIFEQQLDSFIVKLFSVRTNQVLEQWCFKIMNHNKKLNQYSDKFQQKYKK